MSENKTTVVHHDAETGPGEGEVFVPTGGINRAYPQGESFGERHGLFAVIDDGDTTGFTGLVRKPTMPGETTRPYGSWFDEVIDILEELITANDWEVKSVIEKVVIDHDEMTIFIERQSWPKVARWLRDDQDLRFDMCLGVNGVHYPAEQGRELHACYMLFSVTHNRNLRIEVTCPDSDPRIPSVVGIYPGNDWHERETWDLFGIIFTRHPALTRTALPDDWVGHPQRKDYPLGGIPVQFKGATIPPADTRRCYN